MIKIAVIGVGRWGVHLLRNFLQHPHVEVVAVVDPKPERLATVKQHYDLDNKILLTTEWQTIRQVVGLEAVVIATPASTHYTLIADALHWGYHVLAEKPLTLNPVESQALCQLAEKQQRQLMVDHTYLFHPVVERGKTIIQSGQLGDLRYGYATRTHLGPVRQDVDALWDLAIHDIAIFNTWLGQSPVSVQATGQVWLQPGLADLVWLTLTYADNFQAHIHLCWLNPDKQRRLAVMGHLGSLIFDEMSREAPLTLIQGELEQRTNHFIPVNQKHEVLVVGTEEPLQKVCDRFVTSILQNKPDTVSSAHVGTQLVKILAALTESLKQNGQLVWLQSS